VFILAEKASFPIDWMCRKLKVSRASFYRSLRPNVPTPTQVRHDVLDAHVVRVFTREKGMAGRDQITTILGQEGVNIATGTVGTILTGRGLRAVRMRAWKKTTTVDPDARTEHIKNHMLDREGTRDFTSTVPGTRFCGDITYLRTSSGWLYLATIIDLCTRMVVGWSMASHMRTSLIVDALQMARDHGHLDAAGAIFHSDRGSNTPRVTSRNGALQTRSHSRWEPLACAGTMPLRSPFSRTGRPKCITNTTSRITSLRAPR
jgi:transposase InsO family protein